MLVRLLIAVAFLMACARHTSPEPVYRYINVLSGSRVVLGEPFNRPDISERMDDTTHVLRAGTFAGGGTTAIVATTDRAGVLRQLTFTYDGSESLSIKVRDYSESLGPPVERRELPDGTRLYVWQDVNTRFELHFEPGQSPAFWSRLSDRSQL